MSERLKVWPNDQLGLGGVGDFASKNFTRADEWTVDAKKARAVAMVNSSSIWNANKISWMYI